MKPTFMILLGSLFLTPFAQGQPVSIGVKGGVPLTDAFETASGNGSAFFTHTKRYTVGPTIEFHLPARFSIEFDALYSRVGFDSTTTSGPIPSTSNTRANSWQFPILGKFEILPGPIRPFIDAGVSIRNISGVVHSVANAAGITSSSGTSPEFHKSTDTGFTFGAGIAFKAGSVRVSPEFRYVRWGGETFRDPINSLLRTNRNDGTFLLGFTF